MNRKRLVLALMLCVLLCLIMAGAAEQARAATGDQDLASKTGTDIFKRKKDPEKKGASKLQMGVGIGSVIVMVIVMKYL